jgi:hypothetical protein
MKITIHQVDMIIQGERDGTPVDLVRVLHVVAESPADAVTRAASRYAGSLEAVLSTRGPLVFEARPIVGDVLDASGTDIAAARPKVRLTSHAVRNDYEEHYRKVPTEISRVKRLSGGKDQETAIRLYSYSFGTRWHLQVRGYLQLADGSASESFVVASAHMSPEELVALRDSIQAELARAGKLDEGAL